MNGLASSDPVSTQHSSGGGGKCVLAVCTGPGAGHFSSLLCGSGLMDVSLKVAHEVGEGHSMQGPCALPEFVLDPSGLPDVTPTLAEKEGVD